MNITGKFFKAVFYYILSFYSYKLRGSEKLFSIKNEVNSFD